ncbi:MAG: (2Fe-2S)-binding protein [Bacteroidota bacterium]
MRIDRCTCFQQKFAELKETARTHGIETVADLQQIVPFGLRCGLCKPYVERMLETGEVSFKRIILDRCTADSSSE